MSAAKKRIREAFRQAVFTRDRHTCLGCGATNVELDAHHITDRNLLPNGGYVLENGISLCKERCHEKAEVFHRTGRPVPGFSPGDLYEKIKSDYHKAHRASVKLLRRA